jgi:hypothetical protein
MLTCNTLFDPTIDVSAGISVRRPANPTTQDIGWWMT